MPSDFYLKRRQERNNQHFISSSDLASARRRGKQVPGAQKAWVIWTWGCGVDLAELCLYEKPQKFSFMITTLRERRWGWILWRPRQSAAVGSLPVCFNNNFLIQKADHIERLSPQIVELRYALNLCQLSLFYTCSVRLSQQWSRHKLYTIQHQKMLCKFLKLCMFLVAFNCAPGCFISLFLLTFFNSPFSYMQNATTPVNISIFKVDVFNMWNLSLVFSLFSFLCSFKEKQPQCLNKRKQVAVLWQTT